MKQFLLIMTMIAIVFGQNKNYEDDTKSIANLSKAYYETVSGPIGEKRDWDRMRNLFHEDAKLIYSYWSSETGENHLMHMTVDEYIGKLGYTETKGFFEEEYMSVTEGFSSVYQVWSTYHFRVEDGTATGKGVTSYQILFDGKEYKIISMFWVLEDEYYTIPEKYLKKAKSE